MWNRNWSGEYSVWKPMLFFCTNNAFVTKYIKTHKGKKLHLKWFKAISACVCLCVLVRCSWLCVVVLH